MAECFPGTLRWCLSVKSALAAVGDVLSDLDILNGWIQLYLAVLVRCVVSSKVLGEERSIGVEGCGGSPVVA